MERWSDLRPDAAILTALTVADAQGRREDLLAGDSAPEKNQWSNRFADACAKMVADAIRADGFAEGLTVLPDPTGTAEPPTIVLWDKGKKKSKKVDVVIGDLIGGLQVAVSLKGVGFRDKKGLQFDKNVTGRLYELENEVRQLHEYRPQAIVVGMYFLPLGSVCDKRSDRSPSGFASVVAKLRSMTGRTDIHSRDQWHRLDMAFVALYTPADPERFADQVTGGTFEYQDPLPRGVTRYFDVLDDPPRRGRPIVASTLSLAQVVDRIAMRVTGGSDPDTIKWADPEPE